MPYCGFSAQAVDCLREEIDDLEMALEDSIRDACATKAVCLSCACCFVPSAHKARCSQV
jgi:hypothetical protein